MREQTLNPDEQKAANEFNEQRAAEKAREQIAENDSKRLDDLASKTTVDAYWGNLPEGHLPENEDVLLDSPVETPGFLTSDKPKRNGDGTFTIKDSYVHSPDVTFTSEEEVPSTKILRRPDFRTRKHIKTSTVKHHPKGIRGEDFDERGKEIPDFDRVTSVFEEEKTGEHSGRKIKRTVRVGKDKEGKPITRVELDSHGPKGPEDKPRRKVMVSSPEEQDPARRTAKAVAERAAKAQPEPKNYDEPETTL